MGKGGRNCKCFNASLMSNSAVILNFMLFRFNLKSVVF
jgi:hypothetical protein